MMTPRQLRQARGLALDEISREVGVDRPGLSRAERGFQRLTDEKVAKVALVLGVSFKQLRRALDAEWASTSKLVGARKVRP